MTTSAVSAEWVDSDHFMGPRMKKITFECERCGHQWTRCYKAEPKVDPPCPSKACAKSAEVEDLRKQVENLTRMLEEGRGPPSVGANVRVRAIDETARIVMEDNHLTDLKDNIRMGESMAPKLPGPQQAQADGMFSAASRGRGGVPVINAQPGQPRQTIPAARMNALGKRALTGAYRGNSVAPTAVLPKERPGVVRIENTKYDASRPTAERK